MLVLTMGDPAGISAEITAKAWAKLRETEVAFALVGDPLWFSSMCPDTPIVVVEESLGDARRVFKNAVPCIPVVLKHPAQAGIPSVKNAPSVVESIEKAVVLTLSGKAQAVVTNPISKTTLCQAGFMYPGHTEFISSLCGAEREEVMMMVGPTLKVALTSVHVPLRQAIDGLTIERLVFVGRKTWRALKEDFGIPHPRLAIAGLNPHAGESGYMGREEIEIVVPAITTLRAEGIDISGPWAADSMFTPFSRKQYDAAVCLYHDQGLIPFKTVEMDLGVNVTTGLPLVRTSPDHGTAFNIAGHGLADETSLVEALKTAVEIAATRKKYHEAMLANSQ
ncbi:4-hydroxythreonine-4-phosphate dehydrogenase PdxA [Entomobacter blattae]|nr:4-hydroxythreonine-4-phosphate dehydrogenase PdxA [Entomobacter blattae]